MEHWNSQNISKHIKSWYVLKNFDKSICTIYHVKVNIMYMRLHIWKHILLGENKGQVCGFCGILHPGSLRKLVTRNSYYKPMSDCQYFYEFFYKSALQRSTDKKFFFFISWRWSHRRPKRWKINKIIKLFSFSLFYFD